MSTQVHLEGEDPTVCLVKCKAMLDSAYFDLFENVTENEENKLLEIIKKLVECLITSVQSIVVDMDANAQSAPPTTPKEFIEMDHEFFKALLRGHIDSFHF
jgi:hypothetical protein